MQGKVYVVGIGPGSLEHMSFKAHKVLSEVDVIIGHKTYINLVKDHFETKEFVKSGMKREVERCNETLDIAKSGKNIALISSGDAGVYGMAGIMLEVAADSNVEVEIIPGITSSNASASIVGAPIMHDHATISLSDLLTDWSLIQKRIDLASQGDFVISYYNPKSKSRVTQIVEARDIMLKHKNKNTIVAIVKNTGRDGQEYTLTTLEKMLDHEIDMFTTVIVGNSKTFVKDNKMITPRGYKY